MRGVSIGYILLALTPIVISTPFDKLKRDDLPIVDLGYELHQALSYNETTDVYIFQNIRYAQPPVGNLRFRAPVPPESNLDTILNGSETRTCPQGVPDWQAQVFSPIAKYTNPMNPFSLPAWEADIANASVPQIPFNQDVTEDCLFLDVHVPKKVLQEARNESKGFEGAPVLVWVRGGYTFSSKLGSPTPGYIPSGLLAHAQATKDNMIFVALNYRLGALGFLTGAEVAADGDLNTGLLDQRLALDWVQQNIHIFGGSANCVTIEDAFDDFLAALNVSSLAEARRVDSAAIIAANAAQIKAAPATSYVFRPIKDGNFVQDTIGQMLNDGAFDTDVEVLTAHNSFEGAFFFDPNVETNVEFRTWLNRSIQGFDDTSLDYLMTTLYPPEFDGSLDYVDQSSHEFSVAPGFHLQDLKYTFNDPANPAPYTAIQDTLQRAIVNFVQDGVPAMNDRQPFPHWGSGHDLVNITSIGDNIAESRINETRCAWWQSAQFY